MGGVCYGHCVTAVEYRKRLGLLSSRNGSLATDMPVR
jgi:hypothetical protein